MKKYIFLVSALLSASYAIQAATVRVKNESGHPVWVRINDRTRRGVTQFWANRYGKETEKAVIRGALIAPTVGLSAVGLKENIAELKKEFYQKVPDFEKINSGDSAFFNTGFNKIYKVTFLTAESRKTSIKKGAIIPTIKSLAKRYGNMYAYKAQRTVGTQVTPVIAIENEYGDSELIPNKPGTQNEAVKISIPTLNSFSINPDIGALTTEARIVYKGWKDAHKK